MAATRTATKSTAAKSTQEKTTMGATQEIDLSTIASAMLQLNKMVKSMQEEINGLKSTKATEPSHASVGSGGTVRLVANPTDPQLREFAVAHDLLVNSRGAIAATHPIRAAYAEAYASQEGKVKVRANGAPKSSGVNWWDAPVVSAERQFTPRPSAKEAAREFSLHPEAEYVESIPAPVLRNLARAGKENAHPSLRNAPIGGNHRRCIMLLANGTDTPSVKLVVADAIAIMRDAGIALPEF